MSDFYCANRTDNKGQAGFCGTHPRALMRGGPLGPKAAGRAERRLGSVPQGAGQGHLLRVF